jgi:hypothetical protein
VRVIHENRYFTCHVGDDGIVRLRRTPAAFESATEIETTLLAMIQAFAGMHGLRLLLDLREGPMRNDPVFEAALGRHWPQVMKPFGPVAVLVRSAVGKLQVTRLGRQAGGAPAVFHDEKEALDYLSTASGR